MWKMKSLAPIRYSDTERSILLECYADTLVYRKDKGGRTLTAIRFGGYPEQVRGFSDAIKSGIRFSALIDGQAVTVFTDAKKYRDKVTHDGIYAESTVIIKDDEAGEIENNSASEVSNPDVRRKMYIFCPEGDSDALYEELDRKTSVPLIPEFKDYILKECVNKGVLVPLEVVTAGGTRFDAYQIAMYGDDREMFDIVGDGIKSGQIAIPGAWPGGFENIESVTQYLEAYGVTVANRIKSSFSPLFDPASEEICESIKDINGHIYRNVGYSLYPAQLAVAEALKRRLDKSKVGIVVAECGSGKTKIGSVAMAAHQNLKKSFNAVLCPSHLTKKWVREIEETLPNTKAAIVRSLADIDAVYADYLRGKKSVYLILSKERARDGYMRRPAAVYSKSKRAYVCPSCGEIIEMEVKDDGALYWVRADQFFFMRENSQNHKCEHCGAPLWTACNPNDGNIRHNKWVKIGGYGFVYRDFAENHIEKAKNKTVIEKIIKIADNPKQVMHPVGACVRYPMSEYIARQIKSLDGVILDELHLYKGDSGQGGAMETLAGCAKKVIGMTATLINGYSSGLFYLLYRIAPALMLADNKKFKDQAAFNSEYGVTESVFQVEDDEYNANSRTKRRKIRDRLLPGVSPLVYSRFLIDSAVFLSLNDMGKNLPDYEEIPVELNLREDIMDEYKLIQKSFRDNVGPRRQNARKLMSKYLSLLTTYSDQPYGAEPICEPGNPDSVLIAPKDLSTIDELHEKDTAVLDIVEKKVNKGDRVLIYTSWVGIDSQEKLVKLLSEKGYRVAVLEQNVKPEKREEWVRSKVEGGLDVLITNPSLVETGLDLNDFTTLVFYNIGYNLFTFRQSSRRSWRINQTAPRIEVYIMYYKGTMQARAIKLMASKLAAATLVEGNFSEEGLAAMSDCRDMTSQLAKELTLGIRDEVEDVAEMFKKMAIINDRGGKTEDMSKYMNLPEERPEEKQESDKPEIIRMPAIEVKPIKLYETVSGQLTLFDIAV